MLDLATDTETPIAYGQLANKRQENKDVQMGVVVWKQVTDQFVCAYSDRLAFADWLASKGTDSISLLPIQSIQLQGHGKPTGYNAYEYCLVSVTWGTSDGKQDKQKQDSGNAETGEPVIVYEIKMSGAIDFITMPPGTTKVRGEYLGGGTGDQYFKWVINDAPVTKPIPKQQIEIVVYNIVNLTAAIWQQWLTAMGKISSAVWGWWPAFTVLYTGPSDVSIKIDNLGNKKYQVSHGFLAGPKDLRQVFGADGQGWADCKLAVGGSYLFETTDFNTQIIKLNDQML